MLYLDTSVVASLVLNDARSATVRKWFERKKRQQFAISDWTRVEFASAVARLERMAQLDRSQADAARVAFRDEVESAMEVLPLHREDFGLAVDLLAVPASGLRAGDALHLAIVHNAALPEFETLDEGLARAAKLLRIPARLLS
jgi:predicted nucleic acid-binding protein